MVVVAGVPALVTSYVTTLKSLPASGSTPIPSKLASIIAPEDVRILVTAQADLANRRQDLYTAQQQLLAARTKFSTQSIASQLKGADAFALSAIAADNADAAPMAKRASDAQKQAAISKATYANAIALPSVMDTCLTKIAAP